jgi:predicted TIM-barrel fold metal-dependent hydrolase
MKIHFVTKSIIVSLVLLQQFLFVHGQTRIIDMHIHSYAQSHLDKGKPYIDFYGVNGEANAQKLMTETFEAFKKYNIVKAMVSGSPESVETWSANDKDKRVIKGIAIDAPNDFGLDSNKFEQMVKTGKIEVFGEIGTYYSGTTLSDSVWQPYLRICEKYDIPVAVHTGGGDPGGTYSWSPKARLKYGDPYLIEDVLVKYPKLRIYIMHSGEDWHEHALRLMAYYPQLYSDIGALLWVEPLTQRYVTDFLRNAKQAGYLNRVMFGSDQMKWAYAIGKSVDFLNSLDFLTQKEKGDIFYNNAARFLRLK